MKVVISELNWSNGIELLQKKGWDVLYDPNLWQDLPGLFRELKDADALIVRNQTKVDGELLSKGGRLKVIGRLGVGLDNIDLKAASERNIPVVFGKYANANSVAEYVVSAMLSYCRPLIDASANVKEGHWDRKQFTRIEIYGKTLGLVGLGDIGHRVAIRAKALGMTVLGYDPIVGPYDFAVMDSGVRRASLEQIYRDADFISLHVPLNQQTVNLINKDALVQMKASAVLINTSRGGIINEQDLHETLQQKKIAGTFLDVLVKEPPEPDHPLIALDNCWITPHIAGLTEESQVRTSEMVATEVIRELAGTTSMYRANANY